MARPAIGVVLAVLLVLAGCAGGGDGTTTDTVTTTAPAVGEDATETSTQETTASPTTTVKQLSGEHPYVEDGILNGSLLLGNHLQALVNSDSYTLKDSITGTNVNNGSVPVTDAVFLKVNGSQERSNGTWLAYQSWRSPDQPTDSYRNDTTHCIRQSETIECYERPFTFGTYRQFGRDMYFLGTVRKINRLQFEPDGIVTRDGQELFRYTATGFTSDLPETGYSEHLTDVTFVSATVLVTAEGYVYEFTVTVEGESDYGPLRVERTHRVTAMNRTTVDPPGWV